MPQVGTVNYHIHSPNRQAYHIDAGGERGKLISPQHAVTDVVVKDVRQGEANVNFASDSVAFKHAPTRVETFGPDKTWQQTYEEELTKLLKQELGAAEVVIFDHTVRVDDPNSERKPARNVHSDYSPKGAHQRLIDLLGQDKAAQWSQGHYGFINVWRPIENPINSAPLGFVRPSSAPAQDWILLDLIYPDRVGQIMGLVANEAHEWIYRSRMTPDEVAFFNIYDNQGLASIAHSALDLVEDDTVHTIRKSIESRTLVRY